MIGTTSARVFLLKDGGFASKDVSELGVLRFYDSSGRYRGRLEKEGQGPGEFVGISSIFNMPDGYLVYDIILGRLTWVDDDFEYVETQQLGMQGIEIAPLPSGRGLVINGLMGAHAAEGHVIHVRDYDRGFDAAFGGDGRPMDLRADPTAHHRKLAVDPDGHIWTTRLNRYELVEYSVAGDTLAVLRREGEVFGQQSRRGAARGPTPPSERVTSLTFAPDGLLWVTVALADEDWEASLERPRELGIDRNARFDTLIDVIDPTSGRLIASTRSPHFLMPVLMAESSGQVMFSYNAEKETGFLGATVLRLSLDGYK